MVRPTRSPVRPGTPTPCPPGRRCGSLVGMPITTGFNHIATLTPDLDRFVDWYGTVFGATVVHEIEKRDDHPRMIILDLGGGSALNVFEVDDRDEIVGEQRTMGGRGAIDHFGIAVADLATLEQV